MLADSNDVDDNSHCQHLEPQFPPCTRGSESLLHRMVSVTRLFIQSVFIGADYISRQNLLSRDHGQTGPSQG